MPDLSVKSLSNQIHSVGPVVVKYNILDVSRQHRVFKKRHGQNHRQIFQSDEMEFNLEAVVGTIIKGYVQVPDYSAIRDEVEAHKDPGFCRVRGEENNRRSSCWYKVLFVTSESVIIQDVELDSGKTRFGVRNIALSEWKELLVEWIGKDHYEYEDAVEMWNDGYLHESYV